MPPSEAIEVVTSFGVPNPALVIRDYAAAGIVRSTAKVLEWMDADGIHTTGYDEEVSTDLWKRIVREEADAAIWLAGTVRMEGDGPTNDRPHVVLTGLRFATIDIHKIGWSHRGYVLPPEREAGTTGEARNTVAALQSVATAPKRKRRAPNPMAIPEGAILCTINQAGDALGIGRTKVNALMKKGRLDSRKIGRGTRLTVASVMAVAAEGA